MEYADVKAWMDSLVENFNEREQLCELNNSISTFKPDNHVFVNGIDVLADIMGIPLKEKYLGEDFSYPYTYSFEYRGLIFTKSFDEKQGFTCVK